MKTLEDSVQIKSLTARNRLVLPPLTTNWGTPDGRVTPEVIRFYTARSGHMGVVITEAAAVMAEGRIVPGSLGLWEDGQIPGMTELAAAVKDRGALAVAQLNHAGAKGWPFEGMDAWVAPSKVACRPGIRPRSASPAEIKALIRAFEAAAVRAEQAGFDGVEIHGAHLYLLSQFLSPLTNHRTDAYGGSPEKRAALACEVIAAVRKRLGPDYPVFFRLNALEDGGQTPADALVAARAAAGAGADVLDLSLAARRTWKETEDGPALMTTSAYAKDQETGGVTGLARTFAAVGLPVIAVGRLGSRAGAQGALDQGAELVAIGRQMICDPGTALKILEDRETEILPCEACMACFAALGQGKPVACKHNRNLPD